MNDIIIARATPQGAGAIALIRCSGEGAAEFVARMAQLSSGKSLADAPTHTIHHGWVVDPSATSSDGVPALNPTPAGLYSASSRAECGDPGESDFATQSVRVDEVLFLVMRAPRTFTGEDTVEITCHNNDFIIARIIAVASALGARHAKPGEFTERAFRAGKIDLVQAEAINELILAGSVAAAAHNLAQVAGSLSSRIGHIESELRETVAYIEASFDFLDEEQRDLGFDAAVWDRLLAVTNSAEELLRSSSRGLSLRGGVRVALVGNVNAGKSTLLNALVGYDRALVSAQAGTTRDVIEVTQELGGAYWTLVDTAGLRIGEEASGDVERAGIDRSYSQIATADLVLFVCDSSRQVAPDEERVYRELIAAHAAKILFVLSKSDRVGSLPVIASEAEAIQTDSQNASSFRGWVGEYVPVLTVSAATGVGIAALREAIEARVAAIRGGTTGTFLVTQRQLDILTDVVNGLRDITSRGDRSLQYELLSYDVMRVLERLSHLTGKSVSEAVMDSVFRSFCVGK